MHRLVQKKKCTQKPQRVAGDKQGRGAVEAQGEKNP